MDAALSGRTREGDGEKGAGRASSTTRASLAGATGKGARRLGNCENGARTALRHVRYPNSFT